MTTLPRGFREAAYHLMDEEIDRVTAELSSFCESPIEVAFGAAFMLLAGRYYGDASVFEPEHTARDIFVGGRFSYAIETQKKIGRYRVDFLVSRNGSRKAHEIIVECDGHDFHERTKEQAARDRSRDRALQIDGRRVFRFTGSEIYRDAFRCATEVLEALADEEDAP